MLQLGNLIFEIGARLLGREGLARHVGDEKFDQLILIRVDKTAVGIAPFAVVLVERSVRLAAERGVVERHAAALADQLARGAEKGVDGDIEQLREQLERFGIGDGLSGFPAGDRLTGDKNPLRKRILRQTVLRAKIANDITCFHSKSPQTQYNTGGLSGTATRGCGGESKQIIFRNGNRNESLIDRSLPLCYY